MSVQVQPRNDGVSSAYVLVQASQGVGTGLHTSPEKIAIATGKACLEQARDQARSCSVESHVRATQVLETNMALFTAEAGSTPICTFAADDLEEAEDLADAEKEDWAGIGAMPSTRQYRCGRPTLRRWRCGPRCATKPSKTQKSRMRRRRRSTSSPSMFTHPILTTVRQNEPAATT